ncbi:MAG: porin family protein [Bacteroidales bacterium]|nr:porin family protein [Bacteroidales bacterium]
MSYMKKIIVLAAALLLGWQARAQVVANAGYVHAFETMKSANYLTEGFDYDHASLDGFFAGANYYLNLDSVLDGLAAMPGANLSMLFGRYWANDDYRVRELALNLPLQACYTYEINESLKVFGQTGPTLQFALSHKMINDNGTTYPLLSKKNDSHRARNPFNMYWGFAAGVEVIDMLRIEVGFDLGFFNLNRRVEDYDYLKSIKRNFLHIGVGYLF